MDAVVHLAAAVGVGQSMYQIREYVDVNSVGTAVLLEGIAKHPVRKLVVASSMSIYGEGSYATAGGRKVDDAERPAGRGQDGAWDPLDADGTPLVPIPTTEAKPPRLSSVYALSKYDQERLCLMFGQAYRIPTVALRLFNTYGPRQALSNPYTGVLAIFASRLLNGRPPLVYEDGRQRRDFVNVKDVARAFRLALEKDAADGQAVNVASGSSISIGELAQRLAEILGRHPRAVLAGKYRVGDVRHCFADITKARTLLGFEPSVGLEAGMRELAGWLEGARALDRSDEAHGELEARGLAV
jgi:dTDP-L-rhamnose 4-epimerase